LALEATLERQPIAFGFMAVFCGCYLFADHLDSTGKTATDTLGRSYLRRLKERLLDTLGRSTLRDLNDEERRSDLELQSDRAASVAHVIEHSAALPAYGTKIALSAGALLAVDWRIGALVAIAVAPGIILRAKQVSADVDLEGRQRKEGQIGARIENEIYRTDGASRMVLGGLSGSLARTLSHLQAALDGERDQHERRQNLQLLGTYVGYYGAMFGGLAMLYNQYSVGAIEIGTFAFMSLQLKELGEELSNHGETYHAFRRVWDEARRFYRFVEPTPMSGHRDFPDSHRLDLDRATFQRGDFQLSVPNLSIPAGSFAVVHGGSGAGKTTFLEHLAFAAAPTAGSVTVGGVPLSEVRFSEWRSRIVYCGARLALLEGRSVRDILRGSDGNDEYLEARASHPLIRDLIAELMRHHGLDTRVGDGLERGRGFSTGEQHRLLLAAALIPRPQVVFLDEVTSNQSDDFVQTVGELLKGYCAQGSTVIFATHSKRFDGAASHLIRVTGGVVELLSPPPPAASEP
jgi:ABC-type multidrug transport system fused ATPase/permease subunit